MHLEASASEPAEEPLFWGEKGIRRGEVEKGSYADGKQAGVGTSCRCQVRNTPRVEVRARGTGSLRLSAMQTTKFMAVLRRSLSHQP